MAATLVDVTPENGIHVIAFAPETHLDSATTEDLQPELYRILGEGENRRFLLDLANVTLLSSQALGCLVTLRLKAARKGSSIALAGIHPTLDEIIRLTQIDHLYEIYPNRADAVKRLSQ